MLERLVPILLLSCSSKTCKGIRDSDYRDVPGGSGKWHETSLGVQDIDLDNLHFQSLIDYPNITQNMSINKQEQSVVYKAVDLRDALTRDPPETELNALIWAREEELSEIFKAMGANRFIVTTDMVPTLAGLVEDSDHVREETLKALAAALLGQLGPSAQAAVLPLAEGVATSEEQDLREACLLALQAIGPGAAPAAAAIASALEDDNPIIRELAAETLGGLGNATVPYIQQLRSLAKNRKHGDVQFAAVDALRRLGSLAVDAVPELKTVFSDFVPDSSRLQVAAAGALKNIGVDAVDAVPNLAKALSNLDDAHWLRNTAVCEALAYMGTKAAAAAPQLVTAMASGTADVLRKEAWNALMNMGKDAREVLPDIVFILEDGKTDRDAIHTKGMALRILSTWGSDAAPAADTLGKVLLMDDDWDELAEPYGRHIAIEAAMILAALGSQAAKALPSLKVGIMDKRCEIRIFCINFIGYLGAKVARSAIPQLVKALDVSLTHNEVCYDTLFKGAQLESWMSNGQTGKLWGRAWKSPIAIIKALVACNAKWKDSFGVMTRAMFYVSDSKVREEARAAMKTMGWM